MESDYEHNKRLAIAFVVGLACGVPCFCVTLNPLLGWACSFLVFIIIYWRII